MKLRVMTTRHESRTYFNGVLSCMCVAWWTPEIISTLGELKRISCKRTAVFHAIQLSYYYLFLRKRGFSLKAIHLHNQSLTSHD